MKPTKNHLFQIAKGQVYDVYYKDGFHYDSPKVKYTEAEVICCTDKTIKLKNLNGNSFSKKVGSLCFCGYKKEQTITLKRNNECPHKFSGLVDNWFSVYKNRAGKPTIFVLKT